jgi:hypothetical protein
MSTEPLFSSSSLVLVSNRKHPVVVSMLTDRTILLMRWLEALPEVPHIDPLLEGLTLERHPTRRSRSRSGVASRTRILSLRRRLEARRLRLTALQPESCRRGLQRRRAVLQVWVPPGPRPHSLRTRVTAVERALLGSHLRPWLAIPRTLLEAWTGARGAHVPAHRTRTGTHSSTRRAIRRRSPHHTRSSVPL